MIKCLIILICILGNMPCLKAQKHPQPPPLSGAGSSNDISFTIGKVYIEPKFEKRQSITEIDSLPQISTQNPLLHKFTIYPNPVTSVLHISEKNSELPTKFFIYDNSGREVFTGTVNGASIDLAPLPKGNYILKFDLDKLAYIILKT